MSNPLTPRDWLLFPLKLALLLVAIAAGALLTPLGILWFLLAPESFSRALGWIDPKKTSHHTPDNNPEDRNA
jgi:hypothetical protein